MHLKNYNRVLPTRLPLGYSSPFKDTFYYVGPGTIFIFGLSYIDFTRCVPGYKTRSYLFSTPRIRRESIRQEWALSLIRRYPSAGFSCGRPHCDVCGWTEVSLSPGRVIAHWRCHLPFGPIVLSLGRSRGVLAHRPCMLTVLADLPEKVPNWLYIYFLRCIEGGLYPFTL